MYHMNMLSSTGMIGNNSIIFLFDFERFEIEARFPFLARCTLVTGVACDDYSTASPSERKEQLSHVFYIGVSVKAIWAGTVFIIA